MPDWLTDHFSYDFRAIRRSIVTLPILKLWAKKWVNIDLLLWGIVFTDNY